MKVAVGLFVSSALFSGSIAVVYWFIARDPAGTTMLACMALALLALSVYVVAAERHADLYADKPDAGMSEAAGEEVGTFVTHSPAPFWIGLAAGFIALGLVVSPAAAGIGITALLFLGGLMIVRSR